MRLRVPEAERATWDREARAIQTELRGRRDGYRQSALAHLTLLLVSVARRASDVLSGLRQGDEQRLAEVFSVIERWMTKARRLLVETELPVSASAARLATNRLVSEK